MSSRRRRRTPDSRHRHRQRRLDSRRSHGQRRYEKPKRTIDRLLFPRWGDEANQYGDYISNHELRGGEYLRDNYHYKKKVLDKSVRDNPATKNMIQVLKENGEWRDKTPHGYNSGSSSDDDRYMYDTHDIEEWDFLVPWEDAPNKNNKSTTTNIPRMEIAQIKRSLTNKIELLESAMHSQFNRLEDIILSTAKDNLIEPLSHHCDATTSESNSSHSEEEKTEYINIDEKEDDYGLCIICLVKPRSHISIPCGHYMYCELCIKHITNKCPLCRETIDSLIKVFE